MFAQPSTRSDVPPPAVLKSERRQHDPNRKAPPPVVPHARPPPPATTSNVSEAEGAHHRRPADLHRLPRQLPQPRDRRGQLGVAGAGEGEKAAAAAAASGSESGRGGRGGGGWGAGLHGGRYVDVAVPDLFLAELPFSVVQHEVRRCGLVGGRGLVDAILRSSKPARSAASALSGSLPRPGRDGALPVVPLQFSLRLS